MDTPPAAAPVFEPLERARALSPEEMRAARTLAAAAGPELLAQLDEATVTGRCRCGCPSLQLGTSGPAVAASWLLARSPRGRVDHLAVSAVAVRSDDELITATLHVLRGRIAELEFFDAVRGEGHLVDLDSLRWGTPTLE